MSANLENSFWVEFPGIKIYELFNKLYRSDKSRNKESSSRLMWAIYLVMNPESNLYNDPNKEASVAKNWLKDPKFKWENHVEYTDSYRDLVLTTAEKALQNWNEMMIMRDKQLKSLYKSLFDQEDKEAAVSTLEKVDKMLANTAKMFADYAKIKKDYEEEKTTKKGKSISSLSDSDEI